MLALLVALASCTPKESPYLCAEACLDMREDIERSVQGQGYTIDPEEWDALCLAAPAEADCATCFAHVQAAWFAPRGLAWDCGCGLDEAGVAECRQAGDAEDEEIRYALETCLASCEAQGLP